MHPIIPLRLHSFYAHLQERILSLQSLKHSLPWQSRCPHARCMTQVQDLVITVRSTDRNAQTSLRSFYAHLQERILSLQSFKHSLPWQSRCPHARCMTQVQDLVITVRSTDRNAQTSLRSFYAHLQERILSLQSFKHSLPWQSRCPHARRMTQVQYLVIAVRSTDRITQWFDKVLSQSFPSASPRGCLNSARRDRWIVMR